MAGKRAIPLYSELMVSCQRGWGQASTTKASVNRVIYVEKSSQPFLLIVSFMFLSHRGLSYLKSGDRFLVRLQGGEKKSQKEEERSDNKRSY
ncbi:hypothetical protein CEXT_634151 [Caerostris extrusa]|uniref:Uncharacterized protein n=1 Tax=Caerostris extrusa TaxID=172846 RepID=A0AAV4RJ34_CAEEX|nr:hypothetical protein CEXT_634151 [Caerostris extrusa]